MYSINVEKECGCFKRSPFDNNRSFDNKDDALIEAKKMENHMNEEFCGKHKFELIENGNNFVISMKAPAAPQPTAGGCCGGGHC